MKIWHPTYVRVWMLVFLQLCLTLLDEPAYLPHIRLQEVHISRTIHYCQSREPHDKVSKETYHVLILLKFFP